MVHGKVGLVGYLAHYPELEERRKEMECGRNPQSYLKKNRRSNCAEEPLSHGIRVAVE